ncbi:MAG TPA: UDP-N-acetylmuramoyl-L-alanine--D-glutamate ligase [Acidimicrobiales bacterium]
MGRRVLVYGWAITGEAVAKALLARGDEAVAADDRVTEAGRASAEAMGVTLVDKPEGAALDALVRGCDLLAPSPGIPEHHPVIAAARAGGLPVVSELDLAYEWEQARPGGPRPMLGITGTDGKTTTTLLAEAMVEASGRRAVSCGNTEVPLVSALDLPVDVFVVECTSFRLAWAESFRPEAATWLNLASDHLDWHLSPSTYGSAKARIWEHQRSTDAAIAFADDAAVMARLSSAPARHLTFAAAAADYRNEGGVLTGPTGAIAEVAVMRRSLPHDITNALAAAATVLEAGVSSVDAVATALAAFEGVAHRISFVVEADGISWYDDSKATTPHAALTAVRAFDSVVLIAGGRNKDLDLRSMASEPGRMRGVVAIGEAAAAIEEAFVWACPVRTAASMDAAVAEARLLARPGDVVLLSPGCASFDWYKGYAARGDDFARAARALVGQA